MAPPLVSRPAASAGGAATVSAHARRVVEELRQGGGALRIGELTGSPHDLGPLLAELAGAGLVEVVDAEGHRQAPAGTTVLLRSGGYRAQARALTARLTEAAAGTALRVPKSA